MPAAELAVRRLFFFFFLARESRAGELSAVLAGGLVEALGLVRVDADPFSTSVAVGQRHAREAVAKVAADLEELHRLLLVLGNTVPVEVAITEHQAPLTMLAIAGSFEERDGPGNVLVAQVDRASEGAPGRGPELTSLLVGRQRRSAVLRDSASV